MNAYILPRVRISTISTISMPRKKFLKYRKRHTPTLYNFENFFLTTEQVENSEKNPLCMNAYILSRVKISTISTVPLPRKKLLKEGATVLGNHKMKRI